MIRWVALAAAGLGLLTAAAGCAATPARTTAATGPATTATGRPSPASPSGGRSGSPGTSATPGTSGTAAARRLPPFSATASGPLKPSDVPYTWHHGCPVPPRDLRALHVSYIGFDGAAHMGEIIVNASVLRKVIEVFKMLYRARFHIRRMEPVDVFHGSDPKSMAADNTSGFNCRYAVAAGPPAWSMHAYGLAIDVNTVQNPYVESDGRVVPRAGRAYLDRSDIRPGMAYPGGVLVRAFRSIGWGWGGDWTGSPDYQHFSSNGR